MESPVDIIVGFLLLSVLIEGLITYIFGESSEAPSRPWIRYVALALGVVVSVLYALDIFAMVGLVSPVAYVGSVLTGLVLGRGSNYANEFITRLRNGSQPQG